MTQPDDDATVTNLSPQQRAEIEIQRSEGNDSGIMSDGRVWLSAKAIDWFWQIAIGHRDTDDAESTEMRRELHAFLTRITTRHLVPDASGRPDA